MVYPVDLEKMKSDTGFINYLYGLIGLRKYGIGIYISTINGIEEVITAIEKEMKNLEK